VNSLELIGRDKSFLLRICHIWRRYFWYG